MIRIATILLASTFAFAANAQELSIKVNQQDLGVLSRALNERPYGEVAALIAKLQQQIAEQAAQKPAPELRPAVPGK